MSHGTSKMPVVLLAFYKHFLRSGMERKRKKEEKKGDRERKGGRKGKMAKGRREK